MKTLATFTSLEEAQIAVSYLQARQIDAFVADSATFNAMPGLSFAAGHIRVMVSDDQLSDARQALEEVNGATDTPPPPPAHNNSAGYVIAFILTLLILSIGYKIAYSDHQTTTVIRK
ncbi:MAG: putative signal transducing protein [bacterium]